MATENHYEFSSQVIRMLVLRHLVSSSIAPPKNLLFKDIWVSHLFAAVSAVLPSNCFIDPQYTATVSDKKRKKPEEKKKTEKGKEKKKTEEK